MYLRRTSITFAWMALVASMPLHAQPNEGANADGEASASPVRRTEITPYIEASQVLSWQLSPGSDVVTYTQLAAGIDASIAGRNNGGTASVRYERNFAWDNNRSDSDTITGIARGYASIVPQVLTLDVGGMASRTWVDGNGANVLSPVLDDNLTSTTYSAYAGPRLQTRVGDADIDASYRVGYTAVDGPKALTSTGAIADIFDDSVSQQAHIRASTRPGEPLPVGLAAVAGYFREDIDALDQRVHDAYVRGDVTVPITPTLALVGGVGAEDVEVSSRDALRDTNGNPVIGSDGRYVTDKSSPRRIAYDADGLIWDTGVIWRPSQRTTLEAHVGHRYDSATYYGTFTWQPDRRSNVGIGVYDGISGFGGRLNNALAVLPPDFQVIRDPITGQITGCTSTASGANCLDAVLGSVRSSVFRSRGVAGSYSRQFGRLTAGIGAGYDNRKFIAAEGTVLAAANGVEDDSWYVSGNLSGPVGSAGSFSLSSYANWFDSGFSSTGDVATYGASASYTRQIWRRLSARAAVALNVLDGDLPQSDFSTISFLIGLRYDF